VNRGWQLFAIALLALGTGCTGVGTNAHAQALAGSWRGPVVQQSTSSLKPNSAYPTSMTLDGTGNGKIDYPTLGCGGRLVYLGTSGSGFVFRERLSYGHKGEDRRCIDNGTVIVVPEGNALRWTWTGANIVASALLFGQTRVLELTCDACDRNQLRDAEACTRSRDIFAQNRCTSRVSKEWHKCLASCRR
jgi:hypothetical protein